MPRLRCARVPWPAVSNSLRLQGRRSFPGSSDFRQHGVGLFRISRPHQHRRQGVQALLDLLAIGFAQRGLARSVQDPVQLLQVHIDTASGGFHADSPEQFPKPLRQRIPQNLFDRSVRHIAVGLFAASRRLTKQHPVGRSVTGSTESLGIHEGLQKVNRMPVHPLPVIGDPRRHAAENVRRQMFDPDPRQNEKAGVVGDEADIAAPRFGAPADITVATAQVPRRRGPGQAGDRPPLRPHQILQVFSHRLLIAEIMVLLKQAVEQRLFGSAPHLLELPAAAGCADGLRCGRRVDLHRGRAWLAGRAGYAARNSPAGNLIWPARSSMSNRPRHTMSRSAPLACLHCQASQSFGRERAPAFTAGARRSARLYKGCLPGVNTRPRYLSSAI